MPTDRGTPAGTSGTGTGTSTSTSTSTTRTTTPTTDPGAIVTTTETAPTTGGVPTASRPVYRLSGVTKTYRQKNRTVTALAGVDLEIPQGQLVAVQGPTGGGKSTLLQMLGALDRPSSGSVYLGDRDVASLGDRALTDVRATDIGFVFQSFNLIPTLSALENVETAFAGSLANRSRAEVRERASTALREVGLEERLDHLPAELSGGQQQRVAIARALVKDPTVLLADEPTGALDEGTRDEIMGLIERQWKDRGLTVVIVTHDSWVARRAERRLHIKQGQVRDV
jgi:putative ABC transport system ATP-binding protein